MKKQENEKIQFTALELEKIQSIEQINQDYLSLCGQVGQRETELSLLKEQAKKMFINKEQLLGNIEQELIKKYGAFRRTETGEFEKIPDELK